MKLKNLTAAQLLKIINRRPFKGGQDAAQEWAKRIEFYPDPDNCIPKKKLRKAGLLPPVHVPDQSLTEYLSQFKHTEESIAVCDALYDGPKPPATKP